MTQFENEQHATVEHTSSGRQPQHAQLSCHLNSRRRAPAMSAMNDIVVVDDNPILP